jgi:hypothetical protein
MKTAAILYQPEGFDTQGQRLMGRQAAGEGFLKALARHGKAESLYCSTKDGLALGYRSPAKFAGCRRVIPSP